MKKLIWLSLLLLASSVTFATQAPQKLSVILDGSPNPDHAPLFIAEQQGFFKEQGLDVQLISPANPDDAPKLVAAGKADVGITYEPEFMEQVDQGLPLIQIGTLIDKPLDCLVIPRNSGIKTLADLRGKRIGSMDDGLNSVMLKVILAKQGVADTDINFINIRDNLAQALLSHRVDAVTGMMRNFEVPALELNGQKVTTYFPEEYGIPTYSELVFISNIDHAKDDRYPRFLAAIKKAVAYLDAHPPQTWASFIKQYPESNNPLNHEAWFSTMPYFAEEPASVNGAEWEKFAQFLQANHMIKTVQPISRYTAKVENIQI